MTLPELFALLEQLADAVGWHRLKEFLDVALDGSFNPHDADLSEENQDMLQEIARLGPSMPLAALLQAMREQRAALEEYIEARV
jgi:hypothetical protein